MAENGMVTHLCFNCNTDISGVVVAAINDAFEDARIGMREHANRVHRRWRRKQRHLKRNQSH
jgi:hypothetical protein